MRNYIWIITKKTSVLAWILVFIVLLFLVNLTSTLWIVGLMGYWSGSDYTNPTTSLTWAVSVWSWETLTWATTLTTTQALEVSNNSISVIIPNWTQITSSNSWTFNALAIATSTLSSLPIALPTTEQDVWKISFWVTWIKLNFSKPVKIQLPVNTSASTVRIKVKHAWIDWYQTFALTDTMASNCFNGIATPSSNIAPVVSGIATIYTCSASQFIAVVDKQTSVVSNSWGWGWWVRLYMDSCPSWDYSPSYYDRSCWTAPVISKTQWLDKITQELEDMIINIKTQKTISNTTLNQKIRFKYIVESKVQKAKYFWFEVKYIPTYDLSKDTAKISKSIIDNKTLKFDEKQRYVNIINDFLIARYNYELAQVKYQVLKNKYMKQTILLNNVVKKLSK